MNRETKRKLLTRKFSSIEYMEEFRDYLLKGVAGLKASIVWFYMHPPQDVDWQSWHISDRPDGWEQRALPNFERMVKSAINGVGEAKKGNTDVIRSLTGSLQGLSKDMDVLGDEWWGYVPTEVKKTYADNMYKARKRASNIWWTVGEYWDNDEILDNEITGPIDAQDLLHYLQPGEEA